MTLGEGEKERNRTQPRVHAKVRACIGTADTQPTAAIGLARRFPPVR